MFHVKHFLAKGSLVSMVTASPHDDRKGHHYYTTPFARPSCIEAIEIVKPWRPAILPTKVCAAGGSTGG